MESPDQTAETNDSADADPQAQDHPDSASAGSPRRTDLDRYTTGGKLVFVSAVGVAFSAVLPWVSLDLALLDLSNTALGTDVAGVLTLPAGVLIAAGILYSPGRWSRRKFSAVAGLGVVTGLIGTVYLVDPVTAVEIPQGVSEADVRPFVTPEIGLYSTIASGLGVTIGAVLGRYN